MSEVVVIESQAAQEAPNRKSKRGRRIMGLVLILLVLLLLLASFLIFKFLKPAGSVASKKETRGIEWVQSIYGWGMAPDQQFDGPTSASVAPDGTIWVAVPFQKAVMGFNPDGSYERMITAGGTLTGPTAVEVGPDGTLYVVESGKDVVHVISPDDEELTSIGVEEPNCVAVSDDLVVVGAKSGFAILEMDGTLVAKIGGFGKELGQFDMVNGVAIGEDDTIYVSDQYNNRISAYKPDGTGKWIVQTGLPANNQNVTDKTPLADDKWMQLPMRMTVDGAGRVVVVDPFDFALTALSSEDGTVTAKYGVFGRADGEFNYPTSVDYDPDRDWFVVTDTMNNRVQIVRIPDSGSTPISAASRALAGPLRACLIPLLLIVLVLIALWVRKVRRAKSRKMVPVALEAKESKN